MKTQMLFLSLILSVAATAQINPETGYPQTWDELRALDEFNYESRWDDLTLLKTPYWVTQKEFNDLFRTNNVVVEEEKGTAYFKVKNGSKLSTILSVTPAMYGDINEVLKQENQLKQDMKTVPKFFEQVDTGIKDIRCYVRKDRGWIYLFYDKGISFIRIDYQKNLKESLDFYKGNETADPKKDTGLRYVNFLLTKFDKKL